MSLFRELDVVVLRKDLPDFGLQAGDLGTIVHVYQQGNFYEVEFLRSDGGTVAVLTLSEEDLRLPESTEIFHVRSLTPVLMRGPSLSRLSGAEPPSPSGRGAGGEG